MSSTTFKTTGWLLIVVTEAGESLTWKCINIATNTQSSLKGDMNITFIIKVSK